MRRMRGKRRRRMRMRRRRRRRRMRMRRMTRGLTLDAGNLEGGFWEGCKRMLGVSIPIWAYWYPIPPQSSQMPSCPLKQNQNYQPMKLM